MHRFALRGWDERPVDPEDRQEQLRTEYLLDHGLRGLFLPALKVLCASPRRFASALALALRMARGADRPLAWHFAYLAEACRLLPRLRALGVTHLHAHFGTNAAEVAALARALGGPPYSFTVHGPEEFDKAPSLALADKTAGAAFVVAVSSFGRSQLYRWLPSADWPKVRVVHCGLERAFHAGVALAIPEAPRLVCVGRLAEQKGQLLLLEAAARLAARGVAFELVLAGDGELRGELERLIERRGLGARLRITGWIDGTQVRREILAARALVLPSFAEGLPVVLMEAMALRRPVLATTVAGIPELVRHGVDGWLVAPGSVEALEDGLERILSLPGEQLARLGEAARARALERHSVEVEAAKLARLFAGAAA